jgi:hypothetical protein
METQLLRITNESLPKAFVKAVMRDVEWACSESLNSVVQRLAAGQYGVPERDWMLGYERRAIWEKKVRDLAQSFGLDATVKSNTAGNHEFTQIRAGRLLLTCSHKLGPDYFMLRGSDFRAENAKINAILSQELMPFMPPEMRQDDGGLLNAVIFYKVHETHRDKAEYLRLGFPSETNDKWAHKFDFYDILEGYPAESQEKEDKELLIQWKRKLSIGVA